MMDRFEQFTSAISVITRYIQKLERDEMEKHGLRGAFAQYLLVMNRHPEGITAATVCELCDKNKAAVSRILTEMEAKGLIVRKSSGSAYRAQLVLTEAGKEAAEFVRRRASIAVELAGEGIADENRKQFYSTLNLIASNLQTICREGIPEETET